MKNGSPGLLFFFCVLQRGARADRLAMTVEQARVVPAAGRLVMTLERSRVVPAAGRLVMNLERSRVVPAAGRLVMNVERSAWSRPAAGTTEWWKIRLEPASGRHYRMVEDLPGAGQRPALPNGGRSAWSRPAAGATEWRDRPALPHWRRRLSRDHPRGVCACSRAITSRSASCGICGAAHCAPAWLSCASQSSTTRPSRSSRNGSVMWSSPRISM